LTRIHTAMKPAPQMQQIITALCTSHGAPLQFTEPDLIVKIENAPYLPLTIECVGPHQIIDRCVKC